MIRWKDTSPQPPPQEASLLISLEEELSTKELTLYWKKLATVLGPLATITAAIIAAIECGHVLPALPNAPPTNFVIT